MVSLVDLEPARARSNRASPFEDSNAMDSVEMYSNDADDSNSASNSTNLTEQQREAASKMRRNQHQQQKQLYNDASGELTGMVSPDQDKLASIDREPSMDNDMDEEQLKRILTCKRLSEGCNRFNVANMVCRKNSLHIMGEGLAVVTEGEPMRHMSHHMSQNIESTSSSSVSSASLRAGVMRTHQLGGHMSKRNSQDDNTTSCSSSTSLDGPRSPSRRRSSTVSQCSSVLSEGTRQQLNFDLSPDLAPDSSILEANAISPTDFERPASPEPNSFDSGDNSLDMRPISRMSQYCDSDIVLTASPDSTLGDSNENSEPATDGLDRHQVEECESEQQAENIRISERKEQKHEATIRDNLERIISHVSAVKVSSINQMDEAATQPTTVHDEQQQSALATQTGINKRAHTPFGINFQRNKSSLTSSSPTTSVQEITRS